MFIIFFSTAIGDHQLEIYRTLYFDINTFLLCFTNILCCTGLPILLLAFQCVCNEIVQFLMHCFKRTSKLLNR